jgi:uncharacterized protein (TIGR02996 family)
MADDESFLAAILADPHDDLPRLVYADYLEETGREDRGEFIRVHCELARLGQGEVSPEQLRVGGEIGTLARRQREIWKMPEVGYWWGSDCYVSLGRSLFDRALTPQDGKAAGLVRRGFVSEVRLPIAAFLGGECDNCEGTGQNIDPDGPCPCCGGQFESIDEPGDRGWSPGTGQLSGLAAGLFSRHPITAVVVTDRRPVELSGGGWEYIVSDMPDRPNAVPWVVAEASNRGLCKTFASHADAADALSDALVEIGRERAKLKRIARCPSPAGSSAATS